MESLLSKISAYHLISYALTGLILVATYAVVHDLTLPKSPIILFGAIYFVGLLVSRIGSVLLEWPLKAIGIVRYAKYQDFIKAENIDEKVGGLAEQSAFYRTLCCGFLILAILSVCDSRSPAVAGISSMLETFAYFGIALLFLFAYRKQCRFVCDRVNTQLELSK